MKLIECVPNISEGRRGEIISRIAAAADSATPVLHVDSSEDANRSVITMAGAPDEVSEGAFRLIAAAAREIDMPLHRGVHPRIGATDVCPFVPLADSSLEECALLARELGERVASDLGIPVYLYDHASPRRRSLADIRRGEYEGLEEKMNRETPDFPVAAYSPRTGATAIGARPVLIAFNISLDAADPRVAQGIAREFRQAREKGTSLGPGSLAGMKAIGWYLPGADVIQVSCNITNFQLTDLHTVFESCRLVAGRFGATVVGSEIVGLVPDAALRAAGAFYGARPGEALEDAAVRELKLGHLNSFDRSSRSLEQQIARQFGDCIEFPWSVPGSKGL